MQVVREISEIAALLIGVALVSMLVQNAGGTAKVIQAATGGFGNLLGAATLQGNGFGTGFGGMQF
jgi:hypothetical protein